MNDPEKLPFVSCLCPTYGRPRLLENAIACFQRQSYPADRRELVILDDGGQFAAFAGTLSDDLAEVFPGVRIYSTPDRFNSLPGKYNWMASVARGEIIAVWEDDDVYLSRHIESHVAAILSGGEFSKPHKIFSEVAKKVVEKTDTGGRFHASTAFTRKALGDVGGWPETRESGFDTRLLSLLKNRFGIVDPSSIFGPTYCFRWTSTGEKHGQTYAKRHRDPDWWDRAKKTDIQPVEFLTPKLDEFTKRLFAEFLPE